MSHPFTPSFDDLPETLPIFPLSGAVVFPRAQLHLNIFEPRYLNMTFDALGAERMIGMIQPDQSAQTESEVRLYKTGCAGRITTFSETNDGRLLIILTGICRFDIAEEVSMVRGYRRIKPDWQRFAIDMFEDEESEIAPKQLMDDIKPYLDLKKIEADWDSIGKLPVVALINFLSTNLPFEPMDKQALIEAMSASDRAKIIIGLAGMSRSGVESTSQRKH